MSHEEKQSDNAAWACATLTVELRLPLVPLPGDDDRRVHDAWVALSIVPDEIRRKYMADDEHDIPEAAWLAWTTVAQIIANVERSWPRAPWVQPRRNA